jgi:hypothetical protein
VGLLSILRLHDQHQHQHQRLAHRRRPNRQLDLQILLPMIAIEGLEIVQGLSSASHFYAARNGLNRIGS